MKQGVLSGSSITFIAIGIFAGAVGKSAQFPLHTWLPDAMEGPTPVSALIHAATMVAAGVFLVARFFPLFQASDFTMNTVAIIGGVTALLAASMALVSPHLARPTLQVTCGKSRPQLPWNDTPQIDRDDKR